MEDKEIEGQFFVWVKKSEIVQYHSILIEGAKDAHHAERYVREFFKNKQPEEIFHDLGAKMCTFSDCLEVRAKPIKESHGQEKEFNVNLTDEENEKPAYNF